MAEPDQQLIDGAGLVETLSGVLTLSDEPSAVINANDEIVSWNEAWPRTDREGLPAKLSLRDSLEDFDGVDRLLDAVRAGSRDGSVAASGASVLESGAPAQRYDAHWRHFCSPAGGPGYTVVVLRPKRMNGGGAGALMGSDQLIVRQALIEESERLRIGRALHDSVVQDLAWIRSEFVSNARAGSDRNDCLPTIDRLIERVRTLSFELSPPVLADLGIVAALHWLGEHIGERYVAHISVVDDEKEPALTQTMKTIVFRCARELAINAAKYADGGEIVVSCRSTAREAVVQVRDFGPGFDACRVHSQSDEGSGFGLISVEQQIRGIGANFELVSEPGAGTRATIRVPLRSGKGDFDG